MEGPNQAKKAATTAVSPGLYVHGAEKGNHCEAGVLGEIFSVSCVYATYFLSLANLLLAVLSTRLRRPGSELFLAERSSDGPDSAYVDLVDTPPCAREGSLFCDCVRSKIC